MAAELKAGGILQAVLRAGSSSNSCSRAVNSSVSICSLKMCRNRGDKEDLKKFTGLEI